MSQHLASRLRISVDDADGRIEGFRTRPGGVRLPISEPPHGVSSQSHASRINVTTSRGTVSSPGGALGPRELLQIETDWPSGEMIELRRVLRTPLNGLVQRLEVLEFRYDVRPKGGAVSLGLLHFPGPAEIRAPAQGSHISAYSILTSGFQLTLQTLTSGNGRARLGLMSGSQDAGLTLEFEGDCTLVASISIARWPQPLTDSVTLGLPVPLDQGAFLLGALTPGIIAAPVSRVPEFEVLRPPPALLYHGSKQLPKLLPGDLIRMGELLTCYWEDGLPDFIEEVVNYLRSLRPGRLSSVQLIIVLLGNSADAERFKMLRMRIGDVRLQRSDSSVTDDCALRSVMAHGDLSSLANEINEID